MDDDHSNDFYDDYPLLDFMLSDDLGAGDVYAEDQVVWGPDGPKLAPIESPWANNDDDDDDDDFYVEAYWQSQNSKEEEEFYVLEPKDLSSCYEEWEDYC